MKMSIIWELYKMMINALKIKSLLLIHICSSVCSFYHLNIYNKDNGLHHNTFKASDY